MKLYLFRGLLLNSAPSVAGAMADTKEEAINLLVRQLEKDIQMYDDYVKEEHRLNDTEEARRYHQKYEHYAKIVHDKFLNHEDYSKEKNKQDVCPRRLCYNDT